MDNIIIFMQFCESLNLSLVVHNHIFIYLPTYKILKTLNYLVILKKKATRPFKTLMKMQMLFRMIKHWGIIKQLFILLLRTVRD